MRGEKMTVQERRETLGRVVEHLIAVRMFSSPESLVKRWAPAAAPVSSRVIRRIIKGEDVDFDDLKLSRLSSMLGLRGDVLDLVYAGDVESLRAMRFSDEDESTGVREYVLRIMERPTTATGRLLA